MGGAKYDMVIGCAFMGGVKYETVYGVRSCAGVKYGFTHYSSLTILETSQFYLTTFLFDFA